jgi:hypothetical protein
MVTLYAVVHGAVFERFAEQLREDAARWFLPGESEFLVLPGRPGPRDPNDPHWSHVSATRYRVLLDHLPYVRGEHVFQIDADSRIVGEVGAEILANGVTVTTHPGIPPGSTLEVDRVNWPYERRPESSAYVPLDQGRQYHPGAFVGGERGAFLELAAYVADAVEQDITRGIHARWYEESHLNRYLIDNPPALVLDKRYCWWDKQWGNDPAALGARIVHIDKTAEEFDTRA